MPDDLQELEDKIFERLEKLAKEPPKPIDEKDTTKKKMTIAAVIAACL
jgi:hypothetical protein